jgi:hypothetical protein
LLSDERLTKPSTVLFIASDNDNSTGEFVPEVAAALHRLNKEVLLSGGEGGRDNDGDEAPLHDVLKFNRLSRRPSHRIHTSAPTFAAFARNCPKADFIIINANGEQARGHLAELLKHAHGILLLSTEGDDAVLNDLINSLSPWRDRMLGTIKFGYVK